MSLARTRLVFLQELLHTVRRPLFWFLILLLVLTTWGFSEGSFQIQSGDTTVGGTMQQKHHGPAA
jgi:hypothetical protein